MVDILMSMCLNT